ncbi:hypothetical protein Ga0609869_003602 [Rhodovulum iodosum]|uniref:Peptidase n=1 Tax=Rhodovulum iodosum TaxID=68291 RepID=A0ABV3XYV8_9RHOB|nr:peptidase [Rhodovulum robiginosum]RSK38896.1 peptidase [Rhodovulum robiginosum]
MKTHIAKGLCAGAVLSAAMISGSAWATTTVSLSESIPVDAEMASTATNPFNIVVNFTGGLSATQQTVFSSAENFWESIITGNRYDLALPDLVISAAGVAIDGVGGILGQAGPQTLVRTNGAPQDYAYADTGIMQFDSADLGALEAAGTLFDVIVHEMAHVIGFGTLWDAPSLSPALAGTQSVYTDESGQYTGSYALDTYKAEFSPAASFVPVDIVSGPGTRNAHWDETLFGDGSGLDLMTGFIGGPTLLADSPLVATTLSDTTIASFADIGYTTIVTDPMAPVPVPPALALGLSAFAALGAVSRRRRRAPA